MVAALEGIFRYLIRNYTFKVSVTNYNLWKLTINLKYSFLKGTLENVTPIAPRKAKKKFQTSHFVAGELFFNCIYLIGTYNYFRSNSNRFYNLLWYYSFCRGYECNMLQNTCKMIVLRKKCLQNSHWVSWLAAYFKCFPISSFS